jgi:phage virion morphogenesis protein
MQLHYTIDASGLRDSLNRAIALGRDPSRMMGEIGAYGEASTRERFDLETGPDGQPWKKSLRAQISGGKTLTRDGHLGDSITHISGRDWAAWGTNMLYGPIHQQGGVIRPKHKPSLRFMLAGGGFVTTQSVTIPARPYLGVNGDDEREIVAIAFKDIKGAFYAG